MRRAQDRPAEAPPGRSGSGQNGALLEKRDWRAETDYSGRRWKRRAML